MNGWETCIVFRTFWWKTFEISEKRELLCCAQGPWAPNVKGSLNLKTQGGRTNGIPTMLQTIKSYWLRKSCFQVKSGDLTLTCWIHLGSQPTSYVWVTDPANRKRRRLEDSWRRSADRLMSVFHRISWNHLMVSDNILCYLMLSDDIWWYLGL